MRPRARPATGARRRPRGPFAEAGAVAGKRGGIAAGGRVVRGRICGRVVGRAGGRAGGFCGEVSGVRAGGGGRGVSGGGGGLHSTLNC
jgi:hypothetical protein